MQIARRPTYLILRLTVVYCRILLAIVAKNICTIYTETGATLKKNHAHFFIMQDIARVRPYTEKKFQ